LPLAQLRHYWAFELEAYWREQDRQVAYGHAGALAEAIS
jgi:hypothetical protein